VEAADYLQVTAGFLNTLLPGDYTELQAKITLVAMKKAAEIKLEDQLI
jgi:hypothetical protein